MKMELPHSLVLTTYPKESVRLSALHDDPRTEPRAVRIAVIGAAVIFLSIFVVLPLVVVFAQAFSKGISAYVTALGNPEALSAIRLTLLIAAISVGLNLV